MKQDIQILKDYLTELLTMDPEYKNKGTEEEVSRVTRIITAEEKPNKEINKETNKETNKEINKETNIEAYIFKCLKNLVDYIEENNVTDETADDGEGHIDEWKSVEFTRVVRKAKEALEGHIYLPLPL